MEFNITFNTFLLILFIIILSISIYRSFVKQKYLIDPLLVEIRSFSKIIDTDTEVWVLIDGFYEKGRVVRSSFFVSSSSGYYHAKNADNPKGMKRLNENPSIGSRESLAKTLNIYYLIRFDNGLKADYFEYSKVTDDYHLAIDHNKEKFTNSLTNI
jgi:hypothetical protein